MFYSVTFHKLLVYGIKDFSKVEGRRRQAGDLTSSSILLGRCHRDNNKLPNKVHSHIFLQHRANSWSKTRGGGRGGRSPFSNGVVQRSDSFDLWHHRQRCPPPRRLQAGRTRVGATAESHRKDARGPHAGSGGRPKLPTRFTTPTWNGERLTDSIRPGISPAADASVRWWHPRHVLYLKSDQRWQPAGLI